MISTSLLSPAKLNLFLKVLYKRKDGYHELITLFERIDLCDKLRFSLNKKGVIRIFCNNPLVPKGSKNLAYQAARMLKEDFAIANGVDIHINKRIPVAAGLAGGSSNAATALIGLNRLWRLSLTKKQLLIYGGRIGSDVPFFLHDCPWAIGTGRGDIIKPIKVGLKLTQVLIVPRIKVYSSQVFRALKLQLTKRSDDVNILIRALQKKDVFTVGQLLSNDLEEAIIGLYPRLVKLKDRLKKFNINGVEFSGSGPSVYGVLSSLKEAIKIKKQLNKRYKQVFTVATF